jgi:hypothetical protein
MSATTRRSGVASGSLSATPAEHARQAGSRSVRLALQSISRKWE